MSNAGLLAWPTGSVNAGWPEEPRSMLPGMVTGWPSGSQRAASNPAEQLLSQAVGWWDAAAYRNGDRLLRNRGVAGDLLDMQLGSSDRVATTNDPLFLAPEDQGYVYQPGVEENFLSIPDEAALDITGDIDLRIAVKLTTPAPNIRQTLFAKWNNVGGANQRSYQFVIDTTGTNGTLAFLHSPDGTSVFSFQFATTTVTLDNTRIVWYRVTLDVDNGAGTPQYEIKFWQSTDNSTWSQVGSTIVGTTGPTSIFASTAELRIGREFISTNPILGNIYRAQVWDGIEGSGGTKVLDVDCDAITDGSATSFTAVTNQTVTINRGLGGRKSVAVPRRNGGGRSLFLLGGDDYFECVGNWQHQLLNFDRQDSFTVLVVVRAWLIQAANNFIFSKRTFTGGGADWGWRWDTNGNIFSGSNAAYRCVFNSPDGSLFSGFSTGTAPFGELCVLANSLNRSGSVNVFTQSGINQVFATGTINNAAVPNPITNTQPVTIGRASGSVPQYMHMEFTAAAVFRRALTPTEIKSITDYYQNRGF